MDDSEYTTITTRFDPPPRGFGPPGRYRYRFKLTDWAKQSDVQEAWAQLIDQHDLKVAKLQDMDIDRIFGFTDGSLLGSPLDLTMNKAKKMGWHGMVDSCEAIKEVLEEFAKIRMLPALKE